jgi:hypothetical protein
MGLILLAPFSTSAATAPMSERSIVADVEPRAVLPERLAPMVVFEPDLAGPVDWAPVQQRLSPELSCFTAPARRDAGDALSRLVRQFEQFDARTPVVLTARGAAAPTVEAFAALHRDRVAGLVLVDPAPALASNDEAHTLKAGGVRKIELDPWRAAAERALAAGPLDRALPVAVVLSRGGPEAWRAVQTAPAKRSHAGYLAMVDARPSRRIDAVLADAVARAVRHVRRLAVEPPMARAFG